MKDVDVSRILSVIPERRFRARIFSLPRHSDGSNGHFSLGLEILRGNPERGNPEGGCKSNANLKPGLKYAIRNITCH